MFRTCLIVALLITLVGAKENYYIAVNDFAGKSVTSDEASVITDKIRDEFSRLSMFKVMARSEMGAIMKEMQLQQSGACSSEECAVEMGKLFGVEQIVTGSIGKIGKMYSINITVVDVATSQIINSVSGEFECRIEDLLAIHAKTMINNLVTEINRKTKCKISVTSNPIGAAVLVNGENVGKTPYVSNFMPEGVYTVELRLTHYASVAENVRLSSGMTVERSYSLNYDKAYTDSIASASAFAAKELKKKNQWQRRISFGLLGAAFAGAGVWCNLKAEAANRDRANAVAAYETAPLDADFNRLRSDVTSAEDSYHRNSLLRSIFYGAGGLAGIGLSLSIAF